MSLFEFTVEGIPLSHQTRNRASLQRWQAQVRAAVTSQWTQPAPMAGMLRVALTYFHAGDSAGIDLDNMVKPILDALNRLVYQDDGQVTDLVLRKTDIDGVFAVRGAPLLILEAMSRGNVFLYGTVGPAPPHSIFLR